MTQKNPKLFSRDYWADRKARRRDWLGLLLLFLLTAIFPVQTGVTRNLCLVLAGASWVSGLLLFREFRWLRILLSTMAALVLFAAVGPGRDFDRGALRKDYLDGLRSYTGVKYVWGGETVLGIDCSGLVREGMIDAALREGLRTGNPRLLRASFAIWHQDCTAAQLGEGYRGRTRPLMETPSLADLDYAGVEPGDIAVTDGGMHTLAYLGNRTWIEADPGEYAGKVIRVTVGRSRNPWLDVPMRILRWRLLDASASAVAPRIPRV